MNKRLSQNLSQNSQPTGYLTVQSTNPVSLEHCQLHIVIRCGAIYIPPQYLRNTLEGEFGAGPVMYIL